MTATAMMAAAHAASRPDSIRGGADAFEGTSVDKRALHAGRRYAAHNRPLE
jgi:hypothetical protein